ncbi:hypothetical protein MY10362_009547 [Beauveria mimosiformis]
MSGLVSSGIAWAFYNNAQSEDIEYKSSAFWQVILQTWFKLEHDYAVICEYSPDGGRSRTDISVFKYDSNHHTLAILNVVEAKRQGNSPKQAEKDALESALKAIDEYKMTGIYAMTIWGTKFRLWMVAAERRKLEPVDEGEDKLGHRASYIDAASDQARCFVDAVNLMKDEPALRRAPILPSQTHLLNQVPSQFIYGSTQIQTDQAGVGPAYPQTAFPSLSQGGRKEASPCPGNNDIINWLQLMRFIDLPIRCGLCRFALEDGEHIVVISKKYKFVSTEIIDDESEIWYKPCKYGRNELDPADAVHRSCFNEAAPDTPNLHALIRNPVTTYSCEPPTEEERRRAYWYRAWFATTLSALFRCYPISSAPELLYMIAAHCVQNLAARSTVLLGLESMTSNFGKRTGTVDASKDIWVTETCFEGYKYIKTLANERPLCGEAILLREENPDQAVVTVYVAEDHLGVRDIVFCGPGKLAAEERPGVWWRTIKGDESILWENDGWKLRRVTNIVCSNWVASKPTRSISRVYFLMSFQAKELKLASPYRSDTQPTSYSFCWNRHLQSIHAQTSNNTTASVYKNHPNSVVWLHVPICDKYISEIWLRKIRGQPCALVLVLQDGETHGRSDFKYAAGASSADAKHLLPAS